MRAGPGEAVVRAESAEPAVHAGAAAPVGHPGPVERGVRAESGEPVGHTGAAESVVRVGAAESVVPGLLVSGPPGSGGADTDGAGPPADGVLPVSYTPLPVRARHRTRVRS
ncbi:hypothetical protein [Streptomyces sp. NPDC052721]|uniref:hypothetical protein n=1 Tax=Streptomyces sp. NPDC052721 TaxID=3154955 RepID=UPI0034126C25